MADEDLKLAAIEHIKVHGNLATWGDNLFVIIDMYELLQKENIIFHDLAEKLWKVVGK